MIKQRFGIASSVDAAAEEEPNLPAMEGRQMFPMIHD
jgi:hypothetical protein